MTDPLDPYGDALRRALALHAQSAAWVCAPDALDRIRAGTRAEAAASRRTPVLALLLIAALLLLTLRGS